MAKTVINKPLYLDIHSLIRVSAPDMPDEINRYIAKKLSLFLTDVVIVEKESDIVISQLKHDHPFTWTNVHMNLEYGFRITECNDETVIIFAYKTKPDIVVILSEPIKIFYQNRKRVFGKLFDVLVFCFHMVLRKRNGMFFHGAVAKNEDKCVLLTGPYGTKKTMLLLTMLKNGWNFISDDKFILHNSNAYLLQPSIIMRAYYFDFLPWIQRIVPDAERIKRSEEFKRSVRAFTKRYFPDYLLPVFQRIYDPFTIININATALFPTCKLIKSANISVVVLLSVGSTIKITNISKSNIIEDLFAVQRLIGYEESTFSSLKELLFLYNRAFRYNMEDIIDSNFSNQVFFKLVLPIDCDLDQAYQELNKCLKQA